MKKIILYTLLPILLTGFSISTYATLDCNKYAKNQNTFNACLKSNQVISSAKKREQARFNEILATKEKAPKKTIPKQSIQAPSTKATPQTKAVPQQQNTQQTAPTITETQPVTPTFQYTPPERVPEPYNPSPATPKPKTEQQNTNRIKYY